MATPVPNIVRIAQYDNSKGLTQTQALAAANSRKLILAPNTEFDRRLVKTDTWKGEREVYPAWTGTQVAYAESGKKPGQFIQYTDLETGIKYTFEVPVEARNEKNVILAINHGFTAEGKPLIAHREDGGKQVFIEIADPSAIKMLEGFPASNGWYLADAEFGIPLGKGVSDSNSDARYLYRVNGSYVGLAARGYVVYDVRRDVVLVRQPSNRAGVLGISTGAQAPAAEKPAHSGVELNGLVADAQAAVQRMVGVVEQGLILPVQKLIDAVQQKQ